uniref:Prophage regulatory protein n=1 Tax=Candidatus Kentrum sp. FM TaxID=2126340 RepID=A0A450VL50_9GAMM|nr:MAG: prophage regulatory protein [Candidatus Kentron sp. FM]VFJ43375.1 MAG: prophage regulatory protein [Candidatus Kentron sp. FM]VFK05519.1 MAG: prophage regulatory protein [Candidatus Kentron sp. FM]
MATRILRLPEVKARTGLSRSSIYLKVSRQEFPAPIRLGKRSIGWIDASIEEWLQERIAISRQEGR